MDLLDPDGRRDAWSTTSTEMAQPRRPRRQLPVVRSIFAAALWLSWFTVVVLMVQQRADLEHIIEDGLRAAVADIAPALRKAAGSVSAHFLLEKLGAILLRGKAG